MALVRDPSLKPGGDMEVWDIEDIVEKGTEIRGCPYFATREMLTDAELVFCPYNYLLDPIIRTATNVNLKNSVIILDEAHNIEDASRECGSFTAVIEDLKETASALHSMHESPSYGETYLPLEKVASAVVHWMETKEPSLREHDFESKNLVFETVDAIMTMFSSFGISKETYPRLNKCFNVASSIAADPETEAEHKLPTKALSLLEAFFTVLRFMFKKDMENVKGYKTCLLKQSKREKGRLVWRYTLNLWCMDPSIPFSSLTEVCHSVVLTSGTLAPMDSFASELKTNFEFKCEAPHVIDMKKQVWVGTIPQGPGSVPLCASYKETDTLAFQDSLGECLLKYCEAIPDGVLAFFPSYAMIDKLQTRWKATGAWAKINKLKKIVVEPKSGAEESFESAITSFYQSIPTFKKIQNPTSKPNSNKRKHAPKGKMPARKKGKKEIVVIDSSSGESEGESEKEEEEEEEDLLMGDGAMKKPLGAGGGLFLAVFRGKVSEGIDFADERARAVILVGIPFAHIKDLGVQLKKSYNNENCSTQKLLTGDKWYTQQAFRALNQAAGRCIRHRLDFGAIILIDKRFQEPRFAPNFSKWVQSSMRTYHSFDESLASLSSFFVQLKADPPTLENIGKLAEVSPEPVPPSTPSTSPPPPFSTTSPPSFGSSTPSAAIPPSLPNVSQFRRVSQFAPKPTPQTPISASRPPQPISAVGNFGVVKAPGVPPFTSLGGGGEMAQASAPAASGGGPSVDFMTARQLAETPPKPRLVPSRQFGQPRPMQPPSLPNNSAALSPPPAHTSQIPSPPSTTDIIPPQEGKVFLSLTEPPKTAISPQASLPPPRPSFLSRPSPTTMMATTSFGQPTITKAQGSSISPPSFHPTTFMDHVDRMNGGTASPELFPSDSFAEFELPQSRISPVKSSPPPQKTTPPPQPRHDSFFKSVEQEQQIAEKTRDNENCESSEQWESIGRLSQTQKKRKLGQTGGGDQTTEHHGVIVIQDEDEPQIPASQPEPKSQHYSKALATSPSLLPTCPSCRNSLCSALPTSTSTLQIQPDSKPHLFSLFSTSPQKVLDFHFFQNISEFFVDDQSPGFWSGSDGCVYQKLFCKKCEKSKKETLVGVKILATDKMNSHLCETFLIVKSNEKEKEKTESPKKKIEKERERKKTTGSTTTAKQKKEKSVPKKKQSGASQSLFHFFSQYDDDDFQ